MTNVTYGELRLETLPGTVLATIASLKVVNCIVEIGTLDGTGSTAAILAGLTRKNDATGTDFVSVEANRAAFELAEKMSATIDT